MGVGPSILFELYPADRVLRRHAGKGSVRTRQFRASYHRRSGSRGLFFIGKRAFLELRDTFVFQRQQLIEDFTMVHGGAGNSMLPPI